VLDTRGYLMSLAEGLVDGLVDTHANRESNPELWDLAALRLAVGELFAAEPTALETLELESSTPAQMTDEIFALAVERYEEKEKTPGLDPSLLRRVERDVMLQIVDAQWKDHLYSLDHLKEGIGLRGYGQRDPLVEYKKESFTLFQAMKDRIDEDMVRYLWRVRPVVSEGGAEPPAPVRQPPRKAPALTFSGGSSSAGPMTASRSASATATGPRPSRTGGDDAPLKPIRRDEPKIGRNDPCYCGSGKKYKKCHGA
jgi:preprotein translocase subunit SecA